MKYKAILVLVGYQPDGKYEDGTRKSRVYFPSNMTTVIVTDKWYDSKEEAAQASRNKAFDHVRVAFASGMPNRIIYENINFMQSLDGSE